MKLGIDTCLHPHTPSIDPGKLRVLQKTHHICEFHIYIFILAFKGEMGADGLVFRLKLIISTARGASFLSRI